MKNLIRNTSFPVTERIKMVTKTMVVCGCNVCITFPDTTEEKDLRLLHELMWAVASEKMSKGDAINGK